MVSYLPYSLILNVKMMLSAACMSLCDSSRPAIVCVVYEAYETHYTTGRTILHYGTHKRILKECSYRNGNSIFQWKKQFLTSKDDICRNM
jgi:hypothetical protein